MERRGDGDRPAARSRAWMHEPTVPARRAVRGPDDAARRGRFALAGGKLVLGVVSALVLAGTGYYWSQLTDFAQDVVTIDVISGAADDGPPIDGAVDILLVGMDSRTDAHGNPLSREQLAMLNAGKADGVLNTDTIMMIHIPVEGGRATGISIPRDAYVDIPGYGKHKINSAYSRKKNDALASLRDEGVTDRRTLTVESNKEGAVSLIATVQQLTGVTIDHYAEVNLLGFYDITKAIGGIEVCLREPVKDADSGANFPAGRQNLSGAPALAFVRQRKGLPNGDIDRVARQQVFLAGMARKAFSADLLAPGSETMRRLQQAVTKSVVLDQGWNIIEFAQQMVDFTGGNLTFQTIPHGDIGMPTPDGKAVEVDPAEVRDFVRGVMPDDATPRAPVDGTPRPASITVNVRNAAQVDGLASGVAGVLTKEGFTIGLVEDASTRDTTVVRHAPGERAAADLVTAALAAPAQVEEDANQQPGQVTVLLGQDYPTVDGVARPGLLDLHSAGQPAGPPAVGDGVCVN
ncbi:LCP family protein [Actinophytocola sp. NPDC049390]|uniref:LCP family protein n=1 Tax=Actinophytocola sp. NPDC049390 TaxID=3363894 RepID=UPI0037A58E06